MSILLLLSACRDYSRLICEGAILYEPDKPAVDTTCINDPATTPMDPVVEWEWPGTTSPNEVASTPLVGQLTDDNGDGFIDGDDDPDIVTIVYDRDSSFTHTLVALDGATGALHWSSLNPVDANGKQYRWSAWSVPAVGDLDGNGSPEVCAPSYESDVVCVDAAGSFAFAATGSVQGWGAITLADLDHDGQVEILRGDRIYSSTGVLLAEAQNANLLVLRSAPVAVQLDSDPEWEVLNGTRAFNVDGSILWQDGLTTFSGVSAVADFDGDALPEVVTTSMALVTMKEHDGTLVWSLPVPLAPGVSQNGLGPPLIADLDGNGTLEIGFSSPSHFTVLDASGSTVWQVAAKDHVNPSWGTGAVAFDFEGDGVHEIIHADAERIRVLDGKTGTDRWSQLTNGFDPLLHGSATIMEYATVADVDKDGSAELLLGSSEWGGVPATDWRGLRVIGSETDAWRPARPVWNQYAYDVQNVNDDGSIPTGPTPNYLAGNTFRTVEDTPEGGYYALPDLYAQSLYSCDVECGEGDPWTVYFSIANDGPAPAVAFSVQLQDGNGAMIFGETVLALLPGETRLFGPWTLYATHWQFGPVRLVVDATDAVEECDESDNAYTIDEFCVY